MTAHVRRPALPLALPLLAITSSALAACFMGTIGGGDPTPAPPSSDTMQNPVPSSWEQHVIHRMTRVEYSNTVRDLLGEPSPVTDALPDDQPNALGFDNDGVSLATSPLLVERYFDLADQLSTGLLARLHPLSSTYAIVAPPSWNQPCGAVSAGQVCGTWTGDWYKGNASSGFWGMLPSQHDMGSMIEVDGISVPTAGTYTLTVKAFSTPLSGCMTGTCTVKLDMLIDTTEQIFDVTNVGPGSPSTYTVTADLIAGLHSFQILSVFIPDFGNTTASSSMTLFVSNPTFASGGASSSGLAASKVLDCGGAAPGSDACTTNALTTFLPRAWRRPVSADEVAALKAISDAITKDASEPGTADDKWNLGMKLAVQSALTSPNFVYRAELDPDPTSATPHPLGDYEIANRLSYFLWSTMPDDELFARAKDGTLHTPAVLDAQVERMLADPKAIALADNFAGQWLSLRKLGQVAPDAKLFPGFSPAVQASMGRESSAFFMDFLAPNKPFSDMLDASYSFLDKTLASYYGATSFSGTDWSKTPLDGTHRVGLLSLGGVLAVTSMPTRTSPVARGKYVLGRLLCSLPPPPPPNVPPFNEDPSAGSVRQRLEAHVKNPTCAGCHDVIDPIGLAMENFDAAGAYRTMDGKYPIDTSGLSYKGQGFHDIGSLAAMIKADPAFVACVSTQFYGYAMGQAPVDGDSAAIAQLNGASPAGPAFRDMIHALVKSAPFLTRAGGL